MKFVPGQPMMGHVSPRGFWHPGREDGCPKCETTQPRRSNDRPR